MPLAERLGLIGPIGEWVIRHACTVAATWPAALTVSVNLSPVQFQDGRISHTVKQALDASGLAPERLELEITEGLLLSHTDETMRQLRELKALGIRIAMGRDKVAAVIAKLKASDGIQLQPLSLATPDPSSEGHHWSPAVLAASVLDKRISPLPRTGGSNRQVA